MEKKAGILQRAARAYTEGLQQAGRDAARVDLNFTLYFEPEDPILEPGDFLRELISWTDREQRELVILEEGMEPRVRVDGKCYVCRLADPNLQRQKHSPVNRLMGTGITHSTGPYLGYKWVYLYEE